ncbi:hypothetical protein ANCCAN_11759, partial [Ancylostoma caninum]
MTYGSNQHRYGRSPRQELLDDMREELLKAKKVNAQLALSNRLLNTKLQRLTRGMKSSSNNNNVVKVSSDYEIFKNNIVHVQPIHLSVLSCFS